MLALEHVALPACLRTLPRQLILTCFAAAQQACYQPQMGMACTEHPSLEVAGTQPWTIDSTCCPGLQADVRLSRLSRGATAQAATALEPLHDNLAMAPVRSLLCCTATQLWNSPHLL